MNRGPVGGGGRVEGGSMVGCGPRIEVIMKMQNKKVGEGPWVLVGGGVGARGGVG